MNSHAKLSTAILAVLTLLTATFGLATAANAEVIRVDVDGDRVRDPVVASVPEPGVVRVATLLSGRDDAFTYVDTAGSGSSEPFIQARGNANRGRGAELFVQTGRNPTVDSIAVLTVARGRLVNARTFFVNPSLSDGLAMGMRCGSVGGEPGISSFLFRLGKQGRWTRYRTKYQWRTGRLAQFGKTTKRKVSIPPASQRTIACPRPGPPPTPPPVLGSAGSRFFTGLGVVEPKSFRARKGTGRYFGFTWSEWGSDRSTARGYFNTGAPGAGKKRLSLTAFDLGRCAGREAYRKLTLKQKGARGITLGVC